MVSPLQSTFKFKPLQETDLDLLCRWLDKPHVKEWWNDSLTHEEIKDKYRERIDSNTVAPFIAYCNDQPIGFIQYYYANKIDNGWWPDQIEGTVGIDQFIGEEELINRGYGTRMIRSFNKILLENPDIYKIIADVDPKNLRAIRCYEKSGLSLLGEIKTPDGLAYLMARYRSPSKTVLITDRLILRTWQTSDIPLMAAINSDPVVMEYFPCTQDLSATQALVDRMNLHYEKHGYTLYAVEIKNTHEFIGFVGLNQLAFDIPHFTPKGLPIVEIGWRLSSTHWDKGYATEAAKAVLHYALAKLKLNEIISFTVPANIRSRHVMEKIGLHHIEADDFDHPKIEKNSPLKRHVLYRLMRNDYQNNHNLIRGIHG
jgi:RimJ/RimL family protein N-acetyltransferase